MANFSFTSPYSDFVGFANGLSTLDVADATIDLYQGLNTSLHSGYHWK